MTDDTTDETGASKSENICWNVVTQEEGLQEHDQAEGKLYLKKAASVSMM